ncbi:Uncharacterised protein [Salmonella enterica subsp. diarizonae]|uniref:Uncharacterized protein n=1 Tax=Salmonella diarizonae TaxID=59204 RepID=A0A379U269_SALDZ|nr:Uncharacterised protein [Salmonella enterica subsp. diarizonae]SUG61632.1 Uncharacterised protein [Salmonella enterica subsp. arizonae]VFS75033.1 Uncharacterised protein [Salmonella enterica subsp. diarizonae]
MLNLLNIQLLLPALFPVSGTFYSQMSLISQRLPCPDITESPPDGKTEDEDRMTMCFWRPR